MPTFLYANQTDVGKKRKINEDTTLVDADLGLFVVADGMGGHQAGEVASRLAVSTVYDYMKRFPGEEDVEELPDTNTMLSKEANRVLAAMHLANQAVYALASSQARLRGMGSTLSLVQFFGGQMVAANVGDSPIYLVRDGKASLLSSPHTVLAEQAALNPGQSEEQLAGSPFRHMLTQAIGVEKKVAPDVRELECRKGDAVLLCSDGLSDKLSPEEMAQAVVRAKPAKAAAEMVQTALDRGGDDNISVVLLQVKDLGGGGGLGSRIRKGLRKAVGRKR